jgi:hypothetical protein
MPHLSSLGGVYILAKYVSNWYSVLAVYAGVLSQAQARFRDGEMKTVSKHDYYSFGEALYRRHCKTCGFRYEQRHDGQTIVSLPMGFKFMIPDENAYQIYSHVLDEIFNMKVYGDPGLEGRSLIDIGAAAGDSSVYFAALGAEVYAFEPQPELFKLLLSNIKLNKFESRIHAFNERISGVSGLFTLERIIDANSLSNVFLKVDCEGCEYDVILNTKDFVFERIKDVILEFHKEPDPIMKRLRDLGFKVSRKREIIRARK